MYIENQIAINHNPLLKRYLREHSEYYKILNRDSKALNRIIQEMQKEYKITIPDRLDKIKDNLSTVTSFMDLIN